MALRQHASRHTSKLFTASGSGGALTVANGDNVQVNGITFATTTANATVFTVTDASDNVLFIINVASVGTFSHEVCWLADAGIKVQSDRNDGRVVVFHNSPGN